MQSLTLSGTPHLGYHKAGAAIRITVKFARAVTVSGLPELKPDVGAHQQRAAYFHGSGSRNLKFAYTVPPTDWDDNGVSVPAGNIILPALSPISPYAAAIAAASGGLAAERSDDRSLAADGRLRQHQGHERRVFSGGGVGLVKGNADG